jgi:hypothetical protein
MNGDLLSLLPSISRKLLDWATFAWIILSLVLMYYGVRALERIESGLSEIRRELERRRNAEKEEDR